MPKTSLVTGSFARNGVPVRGPVTFRIAVTTQIAPDGFRRLTAAERTASEPTRSSRQRSTAS